MDPLTHFMTGACLGRAGLNRRTAYATLAATLAAEAPDIDVVTALGGPVVGFAHHRGITHTLLGAPFMALAVTLIVYGIDRLRTSRPPIPVRWGWVWLVALLADFSHLWLDYTNNYGIRPFYPFSPRWYSLDLVFIVEPLILLALLIALVLPPIFGLVEAEMTRKKNLFRGRGLAIAALTFMVLLWALRNAEHAHAMALARTGTAETGPLTRRPILRVAAEPYPVDPFHWRVMLETPNSYESVDVHTWGDRVDGDPDELDKPPVTPAVAAAKQTRLGQVYLDWARWPFTVDLGAMPIAGAGELPKGAHTVRFTDMRFAPPGADRSPALAGWVAISSAGQVETEVMSGRVQK